MAVLDGQVIGYAGAWIILDESHITNIAIAEAFRGNGYGRLLTQRGLASVSVQPGASYATLEVRKQPARAEPVYQPGLSTGGRRKRYYEDNQEDALLMVCQSLPPVDPEFEEEETVSG